jgi:hypothetical protein
MKAKPESGLNLNLYHYPAATSRSARLQGSSAKPALIKATKKPGCEKQSG